MHSVELSIDVVAISQASKGSFLRLAKLLRKLHEEISKSDYPDAQEAFEGVLEKAGIGRRRAYYLIDIDRVFGDLDVPAKRLFSIGWTKLAVLAPYVNSSNLESLLKLAEAFTVEELRAQFGESSSEPATRFLTFRLADKQYASVLGALLSYGATHTKGGGLAGKEAALVEVCSVSLSAKAK